MQILYINSVAHWKIQKDPSMCPVVLWNANDIKKFVKWLEEKALERTRYEDCRWLNKGALGQGIKNSMMLGSYH